MSEKTKADASSQEPTLPHDGVEAPDDVLNWDVELPAPTRPGGRFIAKLRPRGRAVPIPFEPELDNRAES